MVVDGSISVVYFKKWYSVCDQYYFWIIKSIEIEVLQYSEWWFLFIGQDICLREMFKDIVIVDLWFQNRSKLLLLLRIVTEDIGIEILPKNAYFYDCSVDHTCNGHATEYEMSVLYSQISYRFRFTVKWFSNDYE